MMPDGIHSSEGFPILNMSGPPISFMMYNPQPMTWPPFFPGLRRHIFVRATPFTL